MDIVLIGHVMCHVTQKPLNIWQIGGGFKKRNQAIAFFSFILTNFEHFTFGMFNKKIMRENISNAHI